MNLATEKAAVTYDPDAIDIDALVAAVAKAGYGLAPVRVDAEGTRHWRARPR